MMAKDEKLTGNAVYFPMFIELTGRRVLVVGAGKVGARRAGILAEFGAKVTVLAPEGCEAMLRLEQDRKVVWKHRPFTETDLDGCFFVIAASSDEALNTHIAGLCCLRRIPVNHAGDRCQCDFYFPAIARQGELVVGVTSSGKNHRLVRRFAARLREWLDQTAGRI